MLAGQLEDAIRHFRTAALQGEAAQVGDGKLLDRFIARGDEAAFEQLVHRHGPMVLGVCKRILRNDADAEDAFQATFLVLVRKATSIIPRTQVANWLHGVAHKTALKAKAMTRRRRVKEQEAGTAEDRNTTDRPWESLLEILDGELNALPEKYRAPIVLCDLEGLSYREAAARLGCPQGTLSGRLTRARALLARRIAHRCPSVTAAVLPMLLARAATTSVPPALWTCTLRAGTALAAGKTLTESAASSKVGFLVQGVLKMLLLSKLKTVTSGLLILAAAVLTASMCVTWKSAHAAMPGEDPAPRIVVDQPTPSGKARATGGASERQEAIFEFRGTERSRKVVSLVVAGTAAPVLRLPIKDDVRVLVGGRLVGIDGLRVGSFIAIRLDPTNRVIQDIQSVELPGNAIILRSVKDLAHLEPPSEREVLRALPQGPGGVPRSRKVFRDDIQMVVECLPRQVDPPRFFPQVGRAELHRYHWKCTVYYRETVESRDPSSQPSKRARVEVVYIDKDYLVPVR